MNIIDRFEGALAVVETDDGMLHIPRAELPETAAEGDVLQNTENGWTVDAESTQARREKLAARRRRMLDGGTA